jgi:hypothetical protein
VTCPCGRGVLTWAILGGGTSISISRDSRERGGFAAGWADLVIATALLLMFLRSALRVLRTAWRELAPARACAAEPRVGSR